MRFIERSFEKVAVKFFVGTITALLALSCLHCSTADNCHSDVSKSSDLESQATNEMNTANGEYDAQRDYKDAADFRTRCIAETSGNDRFWHEVWLATDYLGLSEVDQLTSNEDDSVPMINRANQVIAKLQSERLSPPQRKIVATLKAAVSKWAGDRERAIQEGRALRGLLPR